jgi:hypothetical protein
MSKETQQILHLFDVMKSAPESQAIHILQILRCHTDLDTVFSIIQPRISPTRHISSLQRPRAPTRRSGLESELMARHSLSFPPLQPLESSILKSVKSQRGKPQHSGFRCRISTSFFSVSADTPQGSSQHWSHISHRQREHWLAIWPRIQSILYPSSFATFKIDLTPL